MESRNRTRPFAARSSRWFRRWAFTVPLLTAACSGGAPESETAGTISSETFIEAMVALRTSPLVGTSGYLPTGEPERILAEMDLVPDDLRRFVEVHGADVPFMTEVWAEIESRADPEEEPAATIAPGS